MRILITGGAGFIGSNLALRLKAQGRDVTLLDSLAPQIHGADPANTSPLFASVRGEVPIVHAPVCDEDAVAAASLRRPGSGGPPGGRGVFIHGVVEATRRTLPSDAANGEPFGIGSGVATDVLTVAKTLVRLYGRDVPSRRHPASMPTSPRPGDCSASRDNLRCRPHRLAAGVQDQEVAEDRYDRSIRELAAKGRYRG